MNHWKQRFLDFLKQGMTPDKLALCVALGVVLGIFPALGTTTLLCALAGFMWGLNQPALQSVNYLVYPVQLLLLIPFYRVGEFLFQAPPLPVSLEQIKQLLDQSWLRTIQLLWTTTWHAIVAWGLLAPILTGFLYYTLRPLFRNMATSANNMTRSSP